MESLCAHCKCLIPNPQRRRITKTIVYSSSVCSLAEIREKSTGLSSDGYTCLCLSCRRILIQWAAFTDKIKGKLQMSCPSASLSWIVKPSSEASPMQPSSSKDKSSFSDAASEGNSVDSTSCAHCKKKFIYRVYHNEKHVEARTLLKKSVPFHDTTYTLADIRGKCFGLSSDGYAYVCNRCRTLLVKWVNYFNKLMKTLKPVNPNWQAPFIRCQQDKPPNSEMVGKDTSITESSSSAVSSLILDNEALSSAFSLQGKASGRSGYTKEKMPTFLDTDDEADVVLPPPSPPRPNEDTLPPNWRTAKDDVTGDMYYYNTYTRKSQWHHPSFNDLMEKSAAETASLAQNQPGEKCPDSEGPQHIKLEKDSDSKTSETAIEFQNLNGMAKWNCDIGTLIQIQLNKSLEKPTSAQQRLEVAHVQEGRSKLQNDSSPQKQDEENFICSHCNEEFFEKELLFRHEVVHRRFDCEHCPKHFKTASPLVEHAKKHRRRIVICTFESCGKRCKNMAAFMKHNKVHGSFECTVCGYYCSSEATFFAHKESHAEPYKCVRCNVSYRFAKDLHKHELSFQHTGEKAYKCTMCVKSFHSNYQLKNHENIHTGARPYKCPFCPKTFKFSGNLSDHKETHVKVFKCSLCLKNFKNARSLKCHRIMLHSGGKHECPDCTKVFFSRSELVAHKRLHTGEKPFRCSDCEKTFHSQIKMRLHSRIHLAERPFKCPHCDRAFHSGSQLTMHARIHSEERPYKCSWCPKTFKQSGTRRRHERIHHTGEKAFKCCDCDMVFCTKPALISHENKLHKNIVYKCSHCDRAFYTESSRKKHELNHTGEKSFKCLVCEKAFTSAQGLKRHKLIHTEEKPYKCSHCGKGYPDLSHLKHHERRHTGERPFSCDYCDKAFNHKSTLKEHHARCHSGNPKTFKCPQCLKAFGRKCILLVHMRIHTAVKSFKCTTCDRAFTQAYRLKLHQNTHTKEKPEKPFKCSFCDKSFAQPTRLRIHEQSHTGAKLFKCTPCDMSFTKYCNLKAHQRIHTGVKPFQCSDCDKSFFQASHLKLHRYTHTGQKPFQCSNCDKAFTRLDRLKSHQHIHTGEKLFKCSDCDKSFTTSYQLKSHQLIHTGAKPFQCSICGQTFRTKSCCERHEQAHAGID